MYIKKKYTEVLKYIPDESHQDATRFLKLLDDSGADAPTVISALFRWLKGRSHYAAIYHGLEKYYESIITGASPVIL